MRISVIHPGDSFSTHDVYTGLCAGLRANGVVVQEIRLADLLHAFAGVAEVLKSAIKASFNPIAWAGAPVVQQVALQQPDAVIAVSGHKLHPISVRAIRAMGIPIALLCTESPYQTYARTNEDGTRMAGERDLAREYDYVFTNERCAVGAFIYNRPGTVQYLRHAYNPAVHQRQPFTPDLACDAVFIGTAFPERLRLFGTGDWRGVRLVLKGANWDGPLTPETLDRVVPNATTAAYYASATIAINHHRAPVYVDGGTALLLDAESIGPRAYEIAACGGFQLCDDARPELADIYGDTVPTYPAEDGAALARITNEWLARPDARKRLQQAQCEAVQPHTWHARAAEVLAVVTERPRGSALVAPMLTATQ